MQSGKIYGYARVSSKHQNEERQLIALRAFGIRDRDIYCDRQSGKDFDRPNYQRLLLRLQAGDVFVVKSIDRLGRNYNEILYQWRLLTKEKQVFIVVLDMPLLDTRSTRDLTGTLIADIVLQPVSYTHLGGKIRLPAPKNMENRVKPTRSRSLPSSRLSFSLTVVSFPAI